jgi:hypothetical protein
MASGNTTTDSLSDSLPTLIMSARIVREYEGVMPTVVDKQILGEGVGNSWNEVSLAQLTAQAITEDTELDNPQQLSDTLFTITPTVVGINTFITDRVAARISKNAFAKTGALAQNAIQRKKDEDGLTVLDGGVTTTSPTGGAVLTPGHIAAAISRIAGNTTEPGNPPYRAVLHPFQIKDIQDDFAIAGGTTYPIPDGPTAQAWRDGWYKGQLYGASVHSDGNITIDGDDDAIGGVFSADAIVLVQGRAPRTETKREPQRGGGGTSVFLYDEYAYGERSSGNWLYEIQSDATAPTS